MPWSASPTCLRDDATLLLGAAHHRVGSEMLTRLLGALCKSCHAARHWKQKAAASSVMPSSALSRPCRIDQETSTAQGGHNATHLARMHASEGLRLFSSGRWAIAPREIGSALGRASIRWRMVHLIRPPVDVVVSAYLYHLNTSESWAHVVDPPWYSRMRLAPPLPRGYTYREMLRTLDGTGRRTAGVLLQAQHSLRLLAEMVAVAEQCAAQPMQRCTNIWLDAFLHDFDAAATTLLRALGVVPSSASSSSSSSSAAATAHTSTTTTTHELPLLLLLLPVLRRAAKLSASKQRASAHGARECSLCCVWGGGMRTCLRARAIHANDLSRISSQKLCADSLSQSPAARTRKYEPSCSQHSRPRSTHRC